MVKELKRVTYVEDEPDIREVTQIALEALGGFTLDVCACGADAVETAPIFEPDLILLDVMMPVMDGVETFKKLRDIPKLAKTPIVFLTAKAQPDEIELYYALGCAGIVIKPFDSIALPDQIREIWNQQNRDSIMAAREQPKASSERHGSSLLREFATADDHPADAAIAGSR